MRLGSAVLLTALFTALATTAALAHVSTTGQDYMKFKRKNGASCCDDQDCRPVEYERQADGSLIMFPDGRAVPVARELINPLPSDDGNAHWCGRLYGDRGALTYCAILPEQVVEAPGRAGGPRYAMMIHPAAPGELPEGWRG